MKLPPRCLFLSFHSFSAVYRITALPSAVGLHQVDVETETKAAVACYYAEEFLFI